MNGIERHSNSAIKIETEQERKVNEVKEDITENEPSNNEKENDDAPIPFPLGEKPNIFKHYLEKIKSYLDEVE